MSDSFKTGTVGTGAFVLPYLALPYSEEMADLYPYPHWGQVMVNLTGKENGQVTVAGIEVNLGVMRIIFAMPIPLLGFWAGAGVGSEEAMQMWVSQVRMAVLAKCPSPLPLDLGVEPVVRPLVKGFYTDLMLQVMVENYSEAMVTESVRGLYYAFPCDGGR